MTYVIPMAGHGSRFKEAGYSKPKMLIEVHGKTLLEWSVDSLPLDICEHLIFICLKEHEDAYNLSKLIKALYEEKVSQLSFIYLDTVTRGQAETVLKAKHIMEPLKDLVIFNIDTYFQSSSIKNALLRTDTDGVIGAFYSKEDRFSFAKVGSDGYVSETAEKVAISNVALTGLYHFKHASDFIKIAEHHIKRNITTKNEFYIAPMYNDLINEGKKYIVDIAGSHWILGTPFELEYFRKEFKI